MSDDPRTEDHTGPERRQVTGLEVRADDGGVPVLSGYATVYEFPYDVGGFTEVITRGAGAKTANDGDIRLLIGVDTEGQVIGVRVVEHRETPGLGDPKRPRRRLPAGWSVRGGSRLAAVHRRRAARRGRAQRLADPCVSCCRDVRT